MCSRRVRFFVGAVLVLLAGVGYAQSDEVEENFKRLDPAEEQRLRAVLAQPVPQGVTQKVLSTHFWGKVAAARLLDIGEQAIPFMREAVSLVQDAEMPNYLADVLIQAGQFDEAREFRLMAIRTADPYTSALYFSKFACDQVNQNRDAAARTSLTELDAKVKQLERSASQVWMRWSLLRATSKGDICRSVLEQRQGKFQLAGDSAEKAEISARQALAITTGQAATVNAAQTVAQSIRRKLEAYVTAGRLYEAELALADYLRLSREQSLRGQNLARVYTAAGDLRFAQREFAHAENMAIKADQAWERLEVPESHPRRTNTRRDLVLALIGQKKWSQALQEFDRLDALSGGELLRKNQVLYRFVRALVYLGNGRAAQAEPLFKRAAEINSARYGENHFYTAQTTGLQGVALWRSGTAENKARALPLLKAAVRSYMSAANADYLENIGIRKELREITFAAYLEAISSTAGEDATEALGAADWVRGGTVQEALNDAAVRAAASTPALSDVVRRDQDARNEIKGLRSFLSGDAGSAKTPLPQIATQMRERITVLENQRVQLQAEIKAKFPDYERLVRPTSPSVQQVAKQLSPDQALLMLLPTTDAVYVWAVTAERPPAFARAPLSEARVDQLIGRLRRQLDFAAGGGSQFDSAAAFELYDKLLAPLAPTLQGKTQLIVAAGGNLSQIPFGILHTRANGGTGSQAPWLIKEASIAQVPSLSAWLAIKSLAKSKPASQSFAGWGDPTFSASTVAQTNTSAGLARNVALTRAATVADLEALQNGTVTASGLKYADIPPLPDTRPELLAIARTLHADAGSDLHLGPQATRDSVLQANKSGQLGNKRVIAFATHGLMAGDLPNLTQPALALAATGQEQTNPLAPLLTLEDVLTLKLNADWVVLSACNTAAADGKAEEALSGLARGFFYAGSRSLLVTHWAVESESAKELTTSTFAHYAANPNAPKAESLRQAMLQVMANPKYAHPAYWAPYALVGDGGGSAVCNKWLC